LFKALLVAEVSEPIEELSSKLAQQGFTCSMAGASEGVIEEIATSTPDLALIALENSSAGSEVWDMLRRFRQVRGLPLMALISRETLVSLQTSLDVDDFVLEPWDALEVAVRAKQVFWRMKHIDTEG